MESDQRRVISLLVDNQSGVLARVSNLFCRRGFNIDSLTVSATNDPAVSRITVTITSDEKALQQLVLQTERLEVTRQVFVLDSEKSLERELLLLKVESDVHNRTELREIACIYKAKIIDLSPDSMVFELIGRPDKLDAFLKMFEGYNILEQCRTGVPIITVIFNNSVLGMVRQWQTSFYGKRYSQTDPHRKTDFVKLADGFGLKGYRCTNLPEFQEAFADALQQKGPTWIECIIDKDEKVLPMIPGGGDINDIIME